MNTWCRVTAAIKILGTIVGLLSLCACQYDPYTVSYATSKPDRMEVIGHWVATDGTLRDLAQGPYRKARPVIEVAEDGSIRMNDIPDTWRSDFGEGAGKIETFVGTWQLEGHQDYLLKPFGWVKLRA